MALSYLNKMVVKCEKHNLRSLGKLVKKAPRMFQTTVDEWNPVPEILILPGALEISRHYLLLQEEQYFLQKKFVGYHT